MTKAVTARSPQDLVDAGILPAATPAIEKVASQLSIAITPSMMALIDPTDAADPIAAQFVPSAQELETHPDELGDPIGDKTYSPVDGIVHRYPDRVLLKPLHTCAVYCRFCFRREQIGAQGQTLSAEALDKAFAYIEQHTEIWEVILTGGDPFMLSPRRLAEILQRLNAIPHIKIVRVHTRIPVVDPERITTELIQSLQGRAQIYVMIHCNHARELTTEARAACARLIDAGFSLLSQSVLLRGVNDNVETLTELMRAFVENRIKPHYLHHGDLARGTSHFRVPIEEGQALMRALRGTISGLCQPTYMLDIPGGHGKVPVGPDFARRNDKEWIVEDYQGCLHSYNDSATGPTHKK